MFPVAVYLFFIAILLNGTQVSSEDVSPPQETTSNDEINTTTSPKKQNDNTTDAPNKITEATTAQPKLDNDITTNSTEKPYVTITEFVGQNTKETTKSLSENTTNKPTTGPESRTGEATKHVKENMPLVGDVVGPLLEKPKSVFRSDKVPNNVSRSGADSGAPEPSYIGKLTGSLVLPALKARQTLGNAWTKSNQGLKDFGSGTYEAAAGAFNFVKDATSAVMSG